MSRKLSRDMKTIKKDSNKILWVKPLTSKVKITWGRTSGSLNIAKEKTERSVILNTYQQN